MITTTHTHPDTGRLTPGCTGCVHSVRADQVAADIAAMGLDADKFGGMVRLLGVAHAAVVAAELARSVAVLAAGLFPTLDQTRDPSRLELLVSGCSDSLLLHMAEHRDEWPSARDVIDAEFQRRAAYLEARP